MSDHFNSPMQVRSSELQTARDNLEKALSSLSETIARLENRLEIVLLPPPPQDASIVPSQKAPIMTHSPTITHLEAMTASVGRTEQRILELLSRLEV